MKIDEILAAIDTGLQTAGDTAYGTDFEDTCWRCRGESKTDLCESCRAELLAESCDPTQAERNAAFVTVLIHLDIEPFIAALDGLLSSFRRLPPEMQRRILETEPSNNTRSTPT